MRKYTEDTYELYYLSTNDDDKGIIACKLPAKKRGYLTIKLLRAPDGL